KIQLAKTGGKIQGFVQLSDVKSNQQITVTIPEAGIELETKTDQQGKAVFDVLAKKLTLWSPKKPKLYTVKIKTETDEVSDKIGFRTIETKGQDILLNGKSVFLRGISLHDENPLIPGRLRSSGDMKMMLDWAKELGCNYVRLAHYPHSEEMVKLADEMGLLVWAEVPVYWTISWETPETYKNAE